MARTCIFGGTFDPPHIGHLAMAKKAIKGVSLDRLWFSPLNTPWHKKGPKTSFDDRKAMTELLVKNEDKMAVTDIDGRLGGTTYTYKTLSALAKGECKGDELFFLMGADSMEYFHKWSKWQQILKLARPIVVARPGHHLQAPGLSVAQLERFIIIKGFRSLCSSTKVRQQLAERGYSRGLTKAVMQYIRDKGLYGIKKKWGK